MDAPMKRIIPFVSHNPTTCKKQTGNADYYCFSNWAATTFKHDGKTYISSEQWMMACKARLFGDEDTLGKIMRVGKGYEYNEKNDKEWYVFPKKFSFCSNLNRFSLQSEIKQLGRQVT